MQVGYLSDNQFEHWHLLHEEFKADIQQVAFFKTLDERRVLVCQEMIDFLEKYLSSSIETREFKDTFDLKTRSRWNTFGFKGMSGAMFLNMLVNNVSDEITLSDQLRLILPVPKDTNNGRERMQVFLKFLEALISSHQVSSWQNISLTTLHSPVLLSRLFNFPQMNRQRLFSRTPLQQKIGHLEHRSKIHIESASPKNQAPEKCM